MIDNTIDMLGKLESIAHFLEDIDEKEAAKQSSLSLEECYKDIWLIWEYIVKLDTALNNGHKEIINLREHIANHKMPPMQEVNYHKYY